MTEPVRQQVSPQASTQIRVWSAKEANIVARSMVLLLITTTWFRLWRLTDIPPGFWYDEAFNAMDALHLSVGETWPVFVLGNGGRATLFHHLGALALSLFGLSPFVFRLVAVFLSIIAVALMYRWLLILLAPDPNRYWLGLIGATGFAFSFWYLILSRTGYRGAMIPCAFLVTATLFWHGWQKGQLWSMIGAGIGLGLSQYIYQPARLFPLVFGGFVMIWSLIHVAQRRFDNPPQAQAQFSNSVGQIPSLKHIWTGLLLMALTSFVIFLPLGLYFFQNPEALFGHTSSISVFTFVAEGKTTYTQHILEALSVFIGGSAPHWQRNIVGEMSFHVLSMVSFWLGLGLALWRWRQPAYLFLLVSLFVLWLPGPLGVPAVDSLHLSGLYPAYYALVALGVYTLLNWVVKFFRFNAALRHINSPDPSEDVPKKSNLGAKLWGARGTAGILSFLLVFCLNGCMTYHIYFNRWAEMPAVYYAYEGHVVDLVDHLIAQTQDYHVLIPFDFYAFPPTRFMLYTDFPELKQPPRLQQARPVLIATDPSGGLPDPASVYVWLTRFDQDQGATYMLPPPQISQIMAQSQIQQTRPFFDRHGETPLAQFIVLAASQIITPLLLGHPPLNTLNYTFGSEAQLRGYHLSEQWLRPGQPMTLTLYWHLLNHQPAPDSIFIHVIDPEGNQVAQFDRYFLRDWERWRGEGLFITHHEITLSSDIAANTYFIRLGLFNPYSGYRYPILNSEGQTTADAVHLGLFYLSHLNEDNEDGTARHPRVTHSAQLGEHINLVGHTLIQTEKDEFQVRLYWQSTAPMTQNYTIFLQLLDANEQLISTIDVQPMQGNYPTSLWQPNEIIMQTFAITLPADTRSSSYILTTGMYDLATGQRLPIVTDNEPILADGALILAWLEQDLQSIQ